jgi:hypothetical protein
MVCLLGLAFDNAVAQDWNLEPVVRVGGEYDDNGSLNVRTDQETELEGYLVDLWANVSYRSPKTRFFVEPRLLVRSYPGESDFDSNDVFLRSLYEFEGTSHTFGFNAFFDRQSVRTAERNDSDLDIDDPAEIPDNDSGRTILVGDRDKWRIAPYWDYQLSDTTTIGADLNYIDASYSDVIQGGLQDFSDARLSVNLSRSLSDVSTGLFRLTGRSYENEDAARDVQGYGFLVGMGYAISQTTQVTAMFGLEDVDQPNLDADPEIVGFATVTRRLETIRLLAQYRRTISASGSGKLSVRDNINLNFRRRLSETITAGLGVRAYQSRDIGGQASVDNRDYVQLQSEFLWYLTRHFAFEVDYRYTILGRADLGERSNSNRINLWFAYRPNSPPKL